jgi:predicted transcriptional regulator
VSEYEHNEHLLDEIQRLREANYQLREGAEEQKQRIKRLEEAGGVIKASLKRSLNPNEQGECKWLAELPMTDAEFAVFTTAFEAKEDKP